MPEFILDHGSPEGAKAFEALDYFTRGCVEAMFFTECHADNPELDGASFNQLAALTLDAIMVDCTQFQATNATLITSAMRLPACDRSDDGYGLQAAGHDFWFTRNGHGCGYWDRGLGKVGDDLASAARAFGSRDLYRGDDGKLYLS